VSGDDDESSPNPYLDAANRLERVIDIQIETLNGIDDKAEHVTRLIGTVLTLALAVLTLIARFNGEEGIEPIPITVSLPFAAGVILLLAAMAAAILTYVKSRFQIGIGAKSAQVLLGRKRIESDRHLTGLIAIYSTIIPYNKRVVEANATRFVWSLYLLLVGIINLAVAALIFVVPLSWPWSSIILIIDVVVSVALAAYTKRKKYLAVEPQSETESE
jgi:hypothetical protein